MTELFLDFLKSTECEFEEYTDLAAMSPMRISTFARVIVYPTEERKLIDVLSYLSKQGIPYIVVGGMSNVLFKCGRFDGVVVKTTKFATNNEAENITELSSGVHLGGVIRRMSHRGLGGLEGLCGIPGTVGGMVKQNAGAFGYETADRLLWAKCYSISDGQVHILSNREMQFSYRKSILDCKDLILISAAFEFIPGHKADIIESLNSYRARRSSTQPTNCPSLGSTFKRVNGVSAGYYIDKAGLKGYTIGGAQISSKHAGFVINTGGATADDVLRIIDYAKSRVYDSFGIELEEEIEII